MYKYTLRELSDGLSKNQFSIAWVFIVPIFLPYSIRLFNLKKINVPFAETFQITQNIKQFIKKKS